MDVWEPGKLVYFIAFIVPGFISLKLYSIAIPSAYKDSGQQLIDVVAYSSINYAVFLLPIFLVETNNVEQSHPMLYALFYVFVFLIAPIFTVFVLRWIRCTKWAQEHLPHPTGKPWDFFFDQKIPCYIIVELKSGQRVGGYYGKKSFASSAPNSEQLYIEKRWLLSRSGGFLRPVNNTAGVIVPADDVASVEFFKVEFNEE